MIILKIPLNPPLWKGEEEKILPFSKGELEGIFIKAKLIYILLILDKNAATK